jgi:transposase
MANEKRYVAQKRQRRRRKVAKKKVQQYEQAEARSTFVAGKKISYTQAARGKEIGIKKRGRSGRPLRVTSALASARVRLP